MLSGNQERLRRWMRPSAQLAPVDVADKPAQWQMRDGMLQRLRMWMVGVLSPPPQLALQPDSGLRTWALAVKSKPPLLKLAVAAVLIAVASAYSFVWFQDVKPILSSVRVSIGLVDAVVGARA